jgi:hypothetical protein
MRGKEWRSLLTAVLAQALPSFQALIRLARQQLLHGCLTKLSAASANRNEYSAGNVGDATVGLNVCA